MKEQTEWRMKAANDARAAWRKFIVSRVEIALERVSRDPEYIEFCQRLSEDEERADAVLDKLGKEEKRAVREYFEDGNARESYEIDEAYMQGIKDGIHFLSWLGIFQAKEWMK